MFINYAYTCTIYANNVRKRYSQIDEIKMSTITDLERQNTVKEGLHVIVGINGNTGRFLAKYLAQEGYKVRGISRSGSGPEEIETIKADALNLQELIEALNGANVIYHCLGLPYAQWFDKHPQIMQNLIQAATINGPQTKIVFVDNMYAYGKKGAKLGPINEDTPELATDRKGLLRIRLANMLFQASNEGKIRVSIGQASDFFGPEASNSVFNRFVLENAYRLKPAKFFANLDTNHSWIYLPDFARSIMFLGTNDMADGKKWILPHAGTTTIRKFVEQFYFANNIDIPVKVKTRPFFLLNLIGFFNKDIKEYAKMSYQRTSDWIADDSKFRKNFPDWKSTDLNVAFNDTLNWYKDKLVEN